MNSSVIGRPLAWPHLRYPEWAWAKRSAELLQKTAQGNSQLAGEPGCKASDNKPTDQCRGALTAQRRNNVAHELESCLNRASEIDQRCNRFAIRKQGSSAKLWKHPVGDAEAIRPDQPAVLLDPPAIGYVSADHFLTMRGTP